MFDKCAFVTIPIRCLSFLTCVLEMKASRPARIFFGLVKHTIMKVLLFKESQHQTVISLVINSWTLVSLTATLSHRLLKCDSHLFIFREYLLQITKMYYFLFLTAVSFFFLILVTFFTFLNLDNLNVCKICSHILSSLKV